MDPNDPNAVWEPPHGTPQPQPQLPDPSATYPATHADLHQLYGLLQAQQRTIEQLQLQLSQPPSQPVFTPDAAAAMAREFARALGPTLSGPATAQPSTITPHASSIRFPNNTPPFDGKAKHLAGFLFSVESRLNAQLSSFQTETQKIEFFAAFLGNGPGLQYLLGLRRLNHPCLRSYSAFVNAFRAHFEDPDLEGTMKEKLKNLRQTSSVAEYAARFLELVSYVDCTEATKCDDFFVGLQDNIKSHFRYIQRPKTLEALTKACLEADARNRTVDSTIKTPSRATAGPAPSVQYSSTIQYQSSPQGSSQSVAPPAASAVASPASATSGDTVSLPTDTPMDVSATRVGKISADERARRKANNLCFYCGGTHRIRDCPTIPEEVRKASTQPRIV